MVRSCALTLRLLCVNVDTLLAAVRTVADFPTPGVMFKDLTPVLAQPSLFASTLDKLAAPFSGAGVTHVVALEARGYWFGPALAARLGAGFVPARKPGKLPTETLREAYTLEYGTAALEIHADALPEGARVLVHDDVIATGGTAAAACRLIERAGGVVTGCSFVLEVPGLDGRRLLPPGVPVRVALRGE